MLLELCQLILYISSSFLHILRRNTAHKNECRIFSHGPYSNDGGVVGHIYVKVDKGNTIV